MIEQLKTIREALAFLDARFGWAPGEAPAIDALRDALTQLEAMVGEQDPVKEPIELLWQVRSALALACAICDAVPSREPSHLGKLVNAQPDGTHGYRKIHDAESALAAYLTTPTAAPVAQQYEAGDVASASAQGFRDGVASVTQQEPVAWAMPKGDGTFIDVITPAEHAREGGSYTVPLFAHPVAQQPQARPDFTDEWTGYLKDGETPFERFLRERKDLQSLLKLYQRVLEENERLKAQQPQAEPDIHEAQGQLEFLDKKNNALSAAIRKVMARLADLLDEDQFKEIEEIVSFAGVQPQAEAVPTVQIVNCDTCKHSANSCDDYPCNRCGVEFGDGPFDRWEAPQQAEAVPSDVVRDAAPIPDHELVTMYDERPTSDREMIEFAREVERRHGIGVQPQHITDGSPCWCNPDVAYTDPETGASVIVHRRPQ